MKNYIANGHVLTLMAPYAVASGAGLLVGSIFGVATSAADSGASVEAHTTGVTDLTKVSAQAWTGGAKVYWDDTAKNVTTTSSGNTLVAVAANPSSIGRVRLNGSF